MERYLDRFTSAAKSVSEIVYLDAFAGAGFGIDRLTGAAFRGSARIAIETANPPFTRLRYFERPAIAAQLERTLRSEYPGRDIRVYGGDCNMEIARALADLADVRWAPAFAFLDPDGMQLTWQTLEVLASHRAGPRKVELWMLFPTMGILRSLELNRPPPEADFERTDRLFGTSRWRAIFEARQAGGIDGADARQEYLNLMRWRLEEVLHYGQTHPLQIRNLNGGVMYDMIFATDHPAGTKIMSYLYNQAMKDMPAEMRRIRDEKAGKPRLFDVGEYASSENYEYWSPWEPWLGED